MTRQVEITDTQGQAYLAIDRIKGAILTDALKIHSGLYGFMGPAMVLPTVQLVARRQLIKKGDA